MIARRCPDATQQDRQVCQSPLIPSSCAKVRNRAPNPNPSMPPDEAASRIARRRAPSFSIPQPSPSHHHHRRRQHAPPSHSPCSPRRATRHPRSRAPPAGVLRLLRGERLILPPIPSIQRTRAAAAESTSTPPAPGLPRRASSDSGAESASTSPLPALHPLVAGALHRTLQPWSGRRFVRLPTSSLLFFERIRHRHTATREEEIISLLSRLREEQASSHGLGYDSFATWQQWLLQLRIGGPSDLFQPSSSPCSPRTIGAASITALGRATPIGPVEPRQVGSAAAAGTLGRRPGRRVGRSHRGWQAGNMHQRGDLNFASSNQPAAMEASEDSFLGLHTNHLDDMDLFQ